MLTFAGQGYSDAFVANFESIVERLRRGESVCLASGPDDICAPWHAEIASAAHCRSESITQRDIAATLALAEIPELAPLFADAGSCRLSPALIADLRCRFAGGSIRVACVGCYWWQLCTQISADGYSTARLVITPHNE